MSRRISRLLVGLFLAWHGLIVLGGPALHALPGVGHHARSPGDRATPLGEAPDSCAICHFVSQGQLAAIAAPAPLPEGIALLQIVPTRLDSPRPATHRHSPRAPPAA